MATITQRVVKRARRKGVTVVSRRGWKNISPVYEWRRRFRKHKPNPADTLWCHISVTHREEIRKAMRTLHKIGMERFGSGVSYNFGIDMVTGEVGLGQALDAKGTHTVNDKKIPGYSHDQNYVSHAICFIGMPGDKPTPRAIAAAGLLVQAMIEEGALTSGFDFNPHSMAAFKDCPTDNVRAVMPDIQTIATNR